MKDKAHCSVISPGIPLVCFLVLLPLNIPWSQISVTWLGVVHFLACLSPQLGSVLYHLFMNHEGGEPVYHTLLKLDVCGICMINTLGECSSQKLSRISSLFIILDLLSVVLLLLLLFSLWVEFILWIINDLPYKCFTSSCTSIDWTTENLANASNDPSLK